MKWRVYYDDGYSTLNQMNCKKDGVLVVVIEDDACGRLLLHGFDFYMLIDEQWMGADVFGVIDQAKYNLNNIKLVLQGRSVLNNLMQKVLEMAHNDEDFPVKSAKSRMETP